LLRDLGVPVHNLWNTAFQFFPSCFLAARVDYRRRGLLSILS